MMERWLSDDLIVRHILNSPFLSAEYLVPAHLSETGAVSVNTAWAKGGAAQLYIEQQRLGTELLQAGLVAGRPGALEQGMRIFQWALDRQSADGSFPGCGDAFHSTEIFLEAFARAAVLLRGSGDNRWMDVAEVWTSRIRLCADRMTQPAVLDPGLEGNKPFVHRLWILAAALEAAGALTGDGSCRRRAGALATAAAALQNADGVNAERGGYDVNYQSAGLLNAARYYAVCVDESLRAQTRRMIDRGCEWLLGREDGSGSLSVEGSTRAGRENHRSGIRKGVNYWEVLQTAVFSHYITGRPDFYDFARRVAARSGAVSLAELL